MHTPTASTEHESGSVPKLVRSRPSQAKQRHETYEVTKESERRKTKPATRTKNASPQPHVFSKKHKQVFGLRWRSTENMKYWKIWNQQKQKQKRAFLQKRWKLFLSKTGKARIDGPEKMRKTKLICKHVHSKNATQSNEEYWKEYRTHWIRRRVNEKHFLSQKRDERFKAERLKIIKINENGTDPKKDEREDLFENSWAKRLQNITNYWKNVLRPNVEKVSKEVRHQGEEGVSHCD